MTRRRDIHIESNTQIPTRRSLLGALRYEFYWKCLISTLLVHLCICYAIWCHLSHYAYSTHIPFTYSHGPCAQGYNFIPIAFGIMLYAVYIMECWHNRVKISKIKKVHHVEALEYIEKMREAAPIVWWKSICYHYVRRTRQVTRYRNGDAVTTTQAYYERVNTHTAGSMFLYDVCGYKDLSKTLIDLDRYPITKIHFTRGFVFACIQAANEFEDQRSRFFNDNEVRDDYMEVREGLDFADLPFSDQMIVYSSTSRKCPWYLSSTAFWLFSIFLMSWPLRLICELQTAHVNYQVTKLFGTNYLSPSSVNYTGPITRTSTMDSRELELAAQRDNYLIVPSYSEAMLLEPSPANNQIHLPNDHYRNRTRPLVSCNENIVLTNYGAIEQSSNLGQRYDNLRSSFRRSIMQRLPIRSRSMNLIFNRNANRVDASLISTSSNALPRSANGAPPRSVSIGAISAAWRSSGYNSAVSEEPQPCDDRRPLIEPMRPVDEPPPPYEVALRMCVPLYERFRRSATSITSRLNLNSISSSSSKDHLTTPYRRCQQQQQPSSADSGQQSSSKE